MDYDTYSANDAIGKVYIDLNPLLLKADDDRMSTNQIVLSGIDSYELTDIYFGRSYLYIILHFLRLVTNI